MSKENSAPDKSKDLISEFALKLKERGLSEITIKQRVTTLMRFVKLGADLSNPDSVNAILASKQLSTAAKLNHVKTYKAFTKIFKIKWDAPRFKYEPRQRFIPSELEIDQLIDVCSGSGALMLQIMKDTACRASEAKQLRWSDIDKENHKVTITSSMLAQARTLPVSAKTIEMVKALPKGQGDYLFTQSLASLRHEVYRAEKKLAKILQNPRFEQIHLHTLRHWKATMEYSKTKDILWLRRLLGQRSLKSTLIYVSTANSANSEGNKELHGGTD